MLRELPPQRDSFSFRKRKHREGRSDISTPPLPRTVQDVACHAFNEEVLNPSTEQLQESARETFWKATSFYMNTANSPIEVKGLEAEFLTPVSVYRPITKYHALHSDQHTPAAHNKIDIPGRTTLRQLSMSSTWRSLKVADARMLHAMQDALKRGLSCVLREKLFDLYQRNHMQNLSTDIQCPERLSLHSEILIDIILADLERQGLISLNDIATSSSLVQLFLRSCNCFEKMDQYEEDLAIDFVFRVQPETHSTEAEVITKLDTLTFPKLRTQYRMGDVIEIYPKFKAGATYIAVNADYNFELIQHVPWLNWTGVSWKGQIPYSTELGKRVEINIRGTSIEHAGQVFLERTVRTSISFEVLPSDLSSMVNHDASNNAYRIDGSWPRRYGFKYPLSSRCECSQDETFPQLNMRKDGMNLLSFDHSPLVSSFPPLNTKRSTELGFEPDNFRFDEFNLALFGADAAERRRKTLSDGSTIGPPSDGTDELILDDE